jgi:hypothetical protein
MTRQQMLAYIAKNHGDALAQVGLIAVDVPESLFYAIDDAMRKSNDEKRKAEADRCVADLIKDRRSALGITENETEQPQPAAEEIVEETPDVSNE